MGARLPFGLWWIQELPPQPRLCLQRWDRVQFRGSLGSLAAAQAPPARLHLVRTVGIRVVVEGDLPLPQNKIAHGFNCPGSYPNQGTSSSWVTRASMSWNCSCLSLEFTLSKLRTGVLVEHHDSSMETWVPSVLEPSLTFVEHHKETKCQPLFVSNFPLLMLGPSLRFQPAFHLKTQSHSKPAW